MPRQLRPRVRRRRQDVRKLLRRQVRRAAGDCVLSTLKSGKLGCLLRADFNYIAGCPIGIFE